MKKFMSLLLALVMCFSLVSVAFAADDIAVMKAYAFNGNEDMQAYKSKIESLEFTLSGARENIVNNGKVWDVSSAGDNSVLAWLEDSNGNGLYEAYITANGGFIYANENCSYLFMGYSALKKINGMNIFKTDKVRYMESMFEDCKALSSLDVQYFNTGKVVTMKAMFKNCESLVSFIGLDKLDTSAVLYMGSMFYGCKSLTKLNLATFNTYNVTDMSYMFYECKNLKICDFGYEDSLLRSDFAENNFVSEFSTFNVTDMSYMFAECSSLKELNLNGFKTSKAKNITKIFSDCSSVELIDMSNWNFGNFGGKNQALYKIFSGCSALNQLNIYNIAGFNAEFYDFGENFSGVSSVRIFTDNEEFEQSTLWKNVLKYLKGASISYKNMVEDRIVLTFTAPAGVAYYCVSEIDSDENDFVFDDETRSFHRDTKLKIRLYGDYEEYTFYLNDSSKTVARGDYVYIIVADHASIYAVGNGTPDTVPDDEEKGEQGDVATNFFGVFYIILNRIADFFKKLFGLI